ncbi:MAG TPA: DUF58 domain-containing protein [Firmicutes bacterium]|nr:DUF58 domain-containing protein [Candidatus Fermentithermobacillaceae bacterium]
MGNSFRNLALALLVAGAILKRPPVTVLGAFLMGLVLLAKALSSLALGEVSYRRRFSSSTVMAGDALELTLSVENAKPLPVALTCDDTLPKGLEAQGPGLSRDWHAGQGNLRNRFFVGPFETVTRKLNLSCSERGIYSLGPVTLRSGDPFGLYPVYRTEDSKDRVTVLPRVLPVEAPPQGTFYPFGTSPAPSWTYQDPSMLKMVREYAPGDSRRHVDWKSTARSGKLQTRVFDAAFGNRVVICLDIATSRAPWEGIDRDVLESLVVAAASCAHHFAARKFAVGLISNGMTQGPGGAHLAQCPPGQGDSHLAYILAQLAGLGHFAFGTTFMAAQRHFVTAEGSFPLVISALMDQETLSLVESLKKAAPRVGVIIVEPDDRIPRRDEEVVEVLRGMPGVSAMSGKLKGGWARAESLELSPLV